MTKRFVVFIITAALLLSIIGCTETERKPVEPVHEPAESAKIEVPEVKAPEADLPKAEPPKANIPKTKPPKPKPKTAASFHDKYVEILKTYVDDKGMVDYRLLKRKRLALKELLNEFNSLESKEYNSWTKEDKIAFWLNAYNIQMLKIITDNYPIESSRIRRVFWPPTSIRHIKGIWTDYKFMVTDEQFTLDEIDRRFFRKEFDEPRVFLAITHTSLSSPPLRNEPYYGGKLYKQLDEQVRKFLSNPISFRIDRENSVVYLSAIFQPTWHGDEFLSKYGTDKKFKDQPPQVRSVLNFITKYVPEQDIRFLETENYTVKYTKYDWRLNE